MGTRLSMLVLSAFVLLALSGCGKAPEEEIQKANVAFDAAKAAEAEQYAPQSYRAALDTLNAAMAAKQEQDSKFALFRGYGKAKALYIETEAMANKAASDAQAEKERVKALVADMLVQAKAALDSASAALAKAPRGKGSKADIELMKSDLAAAQAGYDDAQRSFDAGKYLAAKPKLEVVMDKARKICSDVAAASGKKMGK